MLWSACIWVDYRKERGPRGPLGRTGIFRRLARGPNVVLVVLGLAISGLTASLGENGLNDPIRFPFPLYLWPQSASGQMTG